jgi:hypothetical protein
LAHELQKLEATDPSKSEPRGSSSPPPGEGVLEAQEINPELTLTDDFRQFLGRLLKDYPDSGNFILIQELSVLVDGMLELQDLPKFRRQVEHSIRNALGLDHLFAVIDDTLIALEKRSVRWGDPTGKRRIIELVFEARSLNELISSENFSWDQLKPNHPYEFTFYRQPRTFRVVFSEHSLEFMRTHRFGVRWITKFLKGPVSPFGEEGLKRRVGGSGSDYEIKFLGRSHRRIAVNFDSASKTWRFEKDFDE